VFIDLPAERSLDECDWVLLNMEADRTISHSPL